MASYPPTSNTGREGSRSLYISVGVISCVVVVLIAAAVITISVTVWLKKRQNRPLHEVDTMKTAENVAYATRNSEMEMSGNISYGTNTGASFIKGDDNAYDYIATTVENDIITSPNEAYSTTDNMFVSRNQAYGMVH